MPAAVAVARYSVEGVAVEARATVRRREARLPYGTLESELMVVPEVAVNLSPGAAIIPVAAPKKPVKLPEDLLEESRRHAQALKMSRSEYMRKAIERMNREVRAQLRAKRIAAASRKVRSESMKVNAEFAAIERDPDA